MQRSLAQEIYSIQDAVDAEGEAFVKNWLKEWKEYWIPAKVQTMGIKETKRKGEKYGKLL